MSITPGTQVRVLTDEGAPWIFEGEVVTIIDPTEWAQEKGLPASHWPADAIAADHEDINLMGPMALYPGDWEVVEQAA